MATTAIVSRRRSGNRRTSITTWVAVIPAAAAMLIVVGLPLLDGIRLSFTDWPGIGPANFIGGANYLAAANNPDVRASIVLTLAYSALTAAGVLVVATLLAAAVSSGVKGSAFYRVVWFLPGVAPLTASAIFWSIAYQPKVGVVNFFLGALGLGNDHAWLAGSSTVLYPVIATTIWSAIGFAFLLILGSMEQVPVEVYEAARIDGASRIRQFFSITIPLIRPVLTITAMLQVIGAANNFGLIYAMTKGGPGNATDILPLLIYKEAFTFGSFGLASAMAVTSGVVLMIIGVVSLRFSRSRQAIS
jgi:raffinose/stachyose/melibiose transport system permease protein